MDDRVDAMAYALASLPKPIRHQPLLTRHGVDCICGVYCGPKLSSWKGHRADRMLLRPHDRFTEEPVMESIYVLRKRLEQTGRMIDKTFREFRARMRPLSEAVAKARLRSGDDYTQA